MTRSQRRNLAIWQTFRERPMSVGGLFWANRRIYFIQLILFGLLGGLVYTNFGWLGSSYVIFAFTIMVARDAGHFIRSVRAWPALRQAIDWNKVEMLLRDDLCFDTFRP